MRRPIGWLTGQQCASGGWAFPNQAIGVCAEDPSSFQGADNQTTSLAVQGLTAQGALTSGIEASALSFFTTGQDADGGWSYYPNSAAQPQQTDSQSTGLVIQALLAMGLSPTSSTFTSSGHSPVTALLSFVVTSGSDTGALGYQDNTSGNLLATNQDVPVLAGLTYGFGPTNSYWVATGSRSGPPVRFGQDVRIARRNRPQQADRRHGVDPQRARLLAGGLRRRHLQLRRRRVPRLPRRPAPEQAHRRHGGHARRRRLLAGGLRRRDLQLRRRRRSSAPAAASPSTSRSSAWRPRPTAAATGWWPPTAGSSATATPTFFGSRGGQPLNKPIVGMAATPDGGGYWLVASDGGIFSYGDAVFQGSTGGIVLNKPIVGMAGTRDGGGYWLIASDGGIFNYGDALFSGSAASLGISNAVGGTDSAS